MSWYEEHPTTSLRPLARAAPAGTAVIDVGVGASFLIDALLERRYTDVTVLGVAAEASTS